MFCPECGASLEDNAVFCSNCGTRVRSGGIPPNAGEPSAKKTSAVPKKKFPIKAVALIVGVFAVIIAVTVIAGSAVSSARPENVASDYLKSYYYGNVEKADKKCIVTMRDQWEISVEKYHNGNKKAYFNFLSSSYERNVTSYGSAYKALDDMTKKRFDGYYGEGYSVEIGKCEVLDLSDGEAALMLSAVTNSDFSGKKTDISLLSGDVMRIRVYYVIDGDVNGTDSHNDLTLIKYDGKWKVLNPLIFGW